MNFSAEFLASLVGGTLVEFKMGQGRGSSEFGRAKITEAKLLEDGRVISIMTDGDVFFEGAQEIVHSVAVCDGVTYFSTLLLDVDVAIAPPGVEILVSL